jgi:hypothetical protein
MLRSCAELTTRKWQSPAGAGLPLIVELDEKTQATVCHSSMAFCDGLLRWTLRSTLTDPIDRNEMMMTAGFRVVLGQHDTVAAFFMVNGSDVVTVRSNHFHVFLYVQTFEHVILLLFSIKTPW